MRKTIQITISLLLLSSTIFIFQNCSNGLDTLSKDLNSQSIAHDLSLSLSSNNVNVGDEVFIFVNGEEAMDFDLIWYHQATSETQVQNSMSRVFEIASAQISDSGSYRVEVFIDGEIIDLGPVSLSVLDPAAASGGGGSVPTMQYQWNAGYCQNGVRTPFCQAVGVYAWIPDSSCTGAKPRGNCSHLSWYAGECVNGNRKITCGTVSGATVEPSACVQSTKPSSTCSP